MYREFRPPPQLRSSIACLWTRSGDGGAVRVMPDACTDIVWRAGNGAAVAGPDTGHWFSATEPGQAIVGVRLLPGAGGAALRLPLAELRDQRVAVSDLGLDPHAQLDPDARPEEVVRRLAALAISLTAAGRPDRAAQAAAIRLMNPGQRVDRLASELGFSERQLRRRFAVAVGYGPKMLQRVLRLRRFLNADAASLAQAALEAGYSDQAHLSRDCRELTGLTPLQLLSGTAEREDADRTELKVIARGRISRGFAPSFASRPQFGFAPNPGVTQTGELSATLRRRSVQRGPERASIGRLTDLIRPADPVFIRLRIRT